MQTTSIVLLRLSLKCWQTSCTRLAMSPLLPYQKSILTGSASADEAENATPAIQAAVTTT